jgi:pimeloyl-ACP methyl ester carboxylesterase
VPEKVFGQELSGYLYAKISEDKKDQFIFKLSFKNNSITGEVDIPENNIFFYQLDTIYSNNNDSLFFYSNSLEIQFEGKIVGDNSELSGKITIEGLEHNINWKREPQVARKQRLRYPTNYISEEITFLNRKENIKLSGTLTLPDSVGQFPLVVLISGSGPQNRDVEIFGHKPFLVLADYLTRHGIAVFRYDDRGTAKSKGKFRPATSKNYAKDASEAVAALKSHPNIDRDFIGLIGHSEGGNIAPMVAFNNSEVDFLILLAAPGVPNIDMYLVQLEYILQENSEEYTYELDYPFYSSIYQSMANIDDKEELRDRLLSLYRERGLHYSSTEMNEFGDYDGHVKSEIARHTTDWYHYFLQFDVTPYLENTTLPILALNGTNDRQVDSKQNLNGIEKILKKSNHTNYKIVELENVSHGFQTSRIGTWKEIYFNDETFSPLALDEIAKWINNNVVNIR